MDRALISDLIEALHPVPTGLCPQTKPKDKIKCILFDIYGTLFISGSGDIGAHQSARFQDEKLQQLIDDFHLDLSPATLVEMFKVEIEAAHQKAKLQGIEYPEVDILSIWGELFKPFSTMTEEKIKEFAVRYEFITNPVYPMPGLLGCLKQCRNSGLMMGVISNAQFYTPLLFKWFLDTELRALGFSDSLVFFSYQQGIAKPSSDLFLKARSRLAGHQIDPRHVVYLGNDMLKDILPAHQAGFQTALFAGDKRSLRLRKEDERCRTVKPDMIITTLSQLNDWFPSFG